MAMSSSAATAAMIPSWITATSHRGFSESAGRTGFRPASRHTGSTYGSTGRSELPRQAGHGGQDRPMARRDSIRAPGRAVPSLQTLWINFTTLLFPAIGLGHGQPAAGLMERKPRQPEERRYLPNHPAKGDDTPQSPAQDLGIGSNRAGPDGGHASQPAA